MATDTLSAVREMAAADGPRQLIDARIRTTRRQVKATEIAMAILTLLAGGLVYLFAFVLIDHWIVPGGVGPVLRFGFFAVLLAGLAGYLAWAVAPLFTRKINPVYAAHAIEEVRPTLKNSLVNFLLLRGQREQVNAVVYQALERRAASDLAEVPLEGAIDHSRLLRLGYVLLGVIAVCCLYTLISPKNPLRSVGRLMAPWSDMRAATRVTIDDVRPGATQAFHDDVVEVSAVVQGLHTGEPVTVLFSTADGRSIDQPLTMQRSESSLRYQATLPGGGAGLQQSLTYRIEAGDATAGPYQIEVVSAPAILVDVVEYDYPDYTGLANRRVERQGDLVALEGTQVKVHARANQKISAAYVDFECDGHRDRDMQANDAAASVGFKLELASDRSGPSHESYQLRFVNGAGQENPRPIRHRIQVTPDQPPVVEIVQPAQQTIEVPINAAVTVEVAAHDADFALGGVWLHAERDGQALVREALLSGKSQAEFRGQYVLSPETLGLRVGDEATFWAEAVDNKQPTANQALTSKFKLRVVDPADDAADNGQRGANGEAARDGQGLPQDQEKLDGQEGNQGEGAAPDEPKPNEERPAEEQKRIDPETNPGDAFNEILDHAKKEQQANPETPQDKQEQQPSEGEQAPGDQQQPEDKPAPGPPEDEQKQPEDQPQEQPPQNQGEQGNGEQGEKQKKPDGEGQQDKQQGNQGQGNQGQGNQGGGQGQNKQGQQEGEGDQAAPAEGGENKDAPPGGEEQKQPSGQGEQNQGEGGAGQQQGGGQGDKQDQGGGEQGGAGEQGTDNVGNPGAGNDPTRKRGDKPGGASGQKKPGAGGQDQQGEGAQGEQQQPGTGENGAQKRKPGDPGQGNPSHEEEPEEGNKDQAQEGEQSKRPSDDAAEEPEGGERPGQSKPGQGGASAGRGDQRPQEGEPDPNAEQPEDATGGDPEKQHGNSGEGESSEQQSPTAESQERNKPRQKTPSANPQGEQKPPGEAASPSQSPHESDSEGGEEGDRSGGGKQGAGQSSNQPGTGGAGQNTAADEGASQAPGAGEGETSNQSGDKQPGGSGQGQGEKQQGEGSGQAPSRSGQPGGGQAGNSDGQSGGGEQPPSSSETSPGGQPGGGAPGDSSGQHGPADADHGEPGGAGPGGQDAAHPQASEEPPPPSEDEVNLDYAREATDLALEHLRDQLAKDQPDQELLDKLQWTRADMEAFLKRWDELKKQAQGQGAEAEQAKRELDEALRGLGLRPSSTAIEGRKTAGDRLRELRQSRRTSPPPEYEEQYRAYTEGTSKRKPGG